MKQLTITKQLLNRFVLSRKKSILESISLALKHGIITFLVLLFTLGIFEFIQGEVIHKSDKVLDVIDFAIASLGFCLMFAAKFLESLYSKQ